MIAGVAWDFGGAWPSYALGFAWGAALTWRLLRAPEAQIADSDGPRPAPREPGSASATRCRVPTMCAVLR